MISKPHHYLLEIFIAIDVLPFVGILKFVCFDILPQCRDDDGSRLGVHTQQAGEARIQFELVRLVIQEEEDCAPHIFISRSLHLSTRYKINSYSTVMHSF